MNKPGYLTTEFWLSTVAVVIGALGASGAIGEGTTASKIVATLASALVALGYTGARLALKSKDEGGK